MIFNATSGSGSVNAESVQYGNTNVDQALSTLESNDTILTNSVNSLTTRTITLENELTANGNRIYLDYKDGKYGYNTSASRGADTFYPFKSGNEYNVITTVNSGTLSTISGHGYITLTRLSGSNTTLNIVIDDNSAEFFLYDDSKQITLFFQKKIQFSGNAVGNTYLYQTVLSGETIDNKYSITQGDVTGTSTYLYGKGKVVLSSKGLNTNVTFSIDGNNSTSVTVYRGVVFELWFNQTIELKAGSVNYPLSYIAYVEL